MGIQAYGEWMQARANEAYEFAKPAGEVVQQAGEVVQQVFTTVTSNYELLDKHIVKLTEENLPKSIAPIVQDAFRSLPVTLGWLFLPTNLVLALIAGNAIAHMIKGNIFCDNTYKNIYNGIAFGAAVECLGSAIGFIQTGNLVCGIAAIISAVSSSVLFSEAHKIPRT